MARALGSTETEDRPRIEWLQAGMRWKKRFEQHSGDFIETTVGVIYGDDLERLKNS